jgi:chaperonin GroEL (HSP60 family)
MQDLAIVTGAEYVAKDLGMKAETVTLEQMGTARKITIRVNETTLIADAANKEEINIRVAQVGFLSAWSPFSFLAFLGLRFSS